MQSRRLLCRRQASEYLDTQHGLDIAPEQLARWAIKGCGPSFRLLAGRISQAVYDTKDLDDWAGRFAGNKLEGAKAELAAARSRRECPELRDTGRCYAGRKNVSAFGSFDLNHMSGARVQPTSK